MDLKQHIEHTLLKQDATREELIKLFEEARIHNFRGICVNGCNVKLAKEYKNKAVEYALSFEGLSDNTCKKILSNAYSDLGDNHYYKKEYDTAEEYYLKALKVKALIKKNFD